MIYRQVLDAVNHGIVILDIEYRVCEWNRWMEVHSGISRDKIINRDLFDIYPQLNTQSFIRSCKSVFKFGNYMFLSQKLHKYLFPFKPMGSYHSKHEFMQQSCTIAPLREDDGTIASIIITVQDITENVYLEDQMRQMVQHDSLTGIYNRRYLDSRLSEEFNRCSRAGHELSIIIFDIDNFKKLNDEFGHIFGDQVLRRLAAVCSAMIRSCDVFCRFGGEEFCVILPESSAAGASAFAERIRQSIADMVVADNGTEVRVTVSLGVASLNPDVPDTNRLLEHADTAMYQSKAAGKNRVSIFRG